MASVVRYFGGVKLGAGGLVRAYTDAVAQALLTAEKVALIKQTRMACSVPYALEGLVRRELELAQAQLTEVKHASLVSLFFELPQTQASVLRERMNEGGRGQLVWLSEDEPS
jgi:putative IMPACT (imprinted ancient) family translation regulator